MTRRMLSMVILTLLFFGSIFGWKTWSGQQMKLAMQSATTPPITVSTATAVATEWTPEIPAVGSLRAEQGVNVTVQVPGLLTELLFQSGDIVEAGTVLARQYSGDQEARLEGLVATRKLTELNMARARELRPQNLISALEFDTRVTELEAARAAEDELRLSIAKKSIRAPFAGRLGIRAVDLGQYLEPGETLVRLEATQRMLIEFPVPQQQIAELHTGQEFTVSVDAWPDHVFRGTVNALEPRIQRETRTVRVQGALANPEDKLTPGMFARVALMLPRKDNVIVVPQAAVVYSPYGDSVYTVSEADPPTVSNQFVVTGRTRGDQVEIVSGLTAGTTVVTAGQQKLRNDAAVRVDNSVPVSNAADPQVKNN